MPGLRVRCWRRRVVRIRSIQARTVVPRVAELVLVAAPMLASAIRISQPRLVASTSTAAVSRQQRLGSAMRWVFTGRLAEGRVRAGWPPWGVRGKVFGLVGRRFRG